MVATLNHFNGLKMEKQTFLKLTLGLQEIEKKTCFISWRIQYPAKPIIGLED